MVVDAGNGCSGNTELGHLVCGDTEGLAQHGTRHLEMRHDGTGLARGGLSENLVTGRQDASFQSRKGFTTHGRDGFVARIKPIHGILTNLLLGLATPSTTIQFGKALQHYQIIVPNDIFWLLLFFLECEYLVGAIDGAAQRTAGY